MSSLNQHIVAANILRRVIRLSGMTIMELARRGRVSYEAFQEALNGDKPLSAKDAIRICMMAGVSVQEIS
jgi:plasmid maintenance system antidote protein VapI